MSQQQKPQQVWIFTFFHVYDLFQLDKCVGGSQAKQNIFGKLNIQSTSGGFEHFRFIYCYWR